MINRIYVVPCIRKVPIDCDLPVLQPRAQDSLRASVSVLVSEDYPGTGVVFVGVFGTVDIRFQMSNTLLFIAIPPFCFLNG